MGRTEQGLKNQRAAQARYDKENTYRINFKFNNRTDADIVEMLKSVDNRQAFVKAAIRAYIKRDTD